MIGLAPDHGLASVPGIQRPHCHDGRIGGIRVLIAVIGAYHRGGAAGLGDIGIPVVRQALSGNQPFLEQLADKGQRLFDGFIGIIEFHLSAVVHCDHIALVGHPHAV